MAKHLGLTTRQFTATYCEKTGGYFHLKETGKDCRFLQNKQCTVYEGRPTQCRTWPFWPENLSAKAWSREVAAFCPGVGKGRTYSAEEIQALAKQDSWTR
jgi:Fe-S-cluster containining protein